MRYLAAGGELAGQQVWSGLYELAEHHYVQVLVYLVFYRLYNAWMSMAYGADADARDEICICVCPPVSKGICPLPVLWL